MNDGDAAAIDGILRAMRQRLQDHWAAVCGSHASSDFDTLAREVMASLQQDRETLIVLYNQCHTAFQHSDDWQVWLQERYLTGRFDECLSVSHLEEAAFWALPAGQRHALCTITTMLQRAATHIGLLVTDLRNSAPEKVARKGG